MWYCNNVTLISFKLWCFRPLYHVPFPYQQSPTDNFVTKQQNFLTKQKWLWTPYSRFWRQSMQCTKNEVSIQNLLGKCDQISSFLQIWSHLLKKAFMENCIFCTVIAYSTLDTLCCDVAFIVLVYDCLFWTPKYNIWQLTNYLFQWD